MKRIIILALALLAVAWLANVVAPRAVPSQGAPSGTPANYALEQAIRQHAEGTPVEGSAVVSRILPDDDRGSRHQRFLVRLPSGDSLLIAHNIDIAPRVRDLRPGDVVEFKGVYEWNEKGGVVHWTHRDPAGQHAAGWLRHHGDVYQ